MRVAVDSRHQNSAGEWVDGATSWHAVIAWWALAEHLAGSAGKGNRVLVHGRLQERTYVTDAGERRKAWKITVDDLGLSLRHIPARQANRQDAAAVG